MSIQEKFEKAVNVIRNLPKNGSYQPSHELQLRFYGYYKQATEGFNYHPRPSFWEVVKRAKWDAWAKLGNMTKEEAMMHYVEELRKIVETMSYTDNVANFLNSLDNFYENVPPEDLEMLVGPIIEKMRSRPDSPLCGSPLASRDTSPTRVNGLSRDSSPLRLPSNKMLHNTGKHITSSLETSPASSYSASPLPPDTDDEDEHFLDTQTEPDRGKDGGSKKSRTENLPPEDHIKESTVSQEVLRPLSTSALQGQRGAPDVSSNEVTLQVPEPVHVTFSTMRKEMEHIKNRLSHVEDFVSNQAKQSATPAVDSCNGPDSKNSSTGIPPEVSVAFKRAIESMTKEMENLQRRMTVVENRRQQEVMLSRKRSGAVVPRWWGLPPQSTIILFAWPLLLLLISKWLSNRRNR